jgi:2-methylcitrate dehydratase PrpD
MEITSPIADYVVASSYDDLSPSVIEATKQCILDTLGVMLPPTTISATHARIHQLALSLGGSPESTLIGFGGRTSSLMAAFVNGALAHGLDFDDTTDSPPHHPTASTLPTALALAERRGGVSGTQLIAAIALANDVSIRLASGPKQSIVVDYPFFPISMFGIWGSTVVGCKLMEFSSEKVKDALGLALHQASGVTEATFSPESDLRSFRDGFTNKSGILAVLLAEVGMTAVRSNSLEIFFRTFYRDDIDPERVVGQLGKTSRADTVSLKPWPSDRETHGYIEGALALRERHELQAQDIEEAILTVGRFGQQALFEPLASKRAPARSINAKLSLPFVIALALTRGRVQLGDFSDASLTDRAVLDMAARVNYVLDPAVGIPEGAGTPAKIAIRTRDGRDLEYVVETLLGHPDNPLGRDGVEAKFLDCASYSANKISPSQASEVVSMVWDLEKLDDVGKICTLLG